MSATKILWGQLIVVSLIALAFVWAATQWTAWRLGFREAREATTYGSARFATEREVWAASLLGEDSAISVALAGLSAA